MSTSLQKLTRLPYLLLLTKIHISPQHYHIFSLTNFNHIIIKHIMNLCPSTAYTDYDVNTTINCLHAYNSVSFFLLIHL